MTDKVTEEVINFFVKFIIIPVFAVFVKISVASMNGGKITKVNIVLSLFVGVAVPFILKDLIDYYISKEWATAVIGFIAILSDKIAETVIKKVKIDLIITSFIRTGIAPTNALLAGGGSLANPVSGTGVNGQVSFWNGVNSQAGDSSFSWNNSTKALSIISPTSDILSVQNTSALGRPLLSILNDSGGALGIGVTGSSFVTTTDFGKAGDAFIRSSLVAKDLNLINTNPTEGAIKFINSGGERMRVVFGGNILIGKTTPDTGEKLQVNGNITATSYSGTATLTGNPTAPTAPAGTNNLTIANTNFVTGAIATAKPYKVYTAILTQTGTSAPVATVLQNTLGGTPVWTRTSTGLYTATLTGFFTPNKTALFASVQYFGAAVSPLYTGTDVVGIQTFITSTGVLSDNINGATIEIRVYN